MLTPGNEHEGKLSVDAPVVRHRDVPLAFNRITNKMIAAGPFLLAAPMFIYPVLHFVYPAFVANIVPPWIPWHRFWTYFTAITIIAGGVSIISKKYAHLVAALLGTEILLFVILIHGPLLFHGPGNAWAESKMFGDFPSRIINAFKDFGLSGAVFIFAGTQSEKWKSSGRDWLLTIGRLIVVTSVAAFGGLHFVYPRFAPAIPPMQVDIQFPIPGHLVWVYTTAVALLLMSAAIAADWRTHEVAVALGFMMLAFDLVTWIPVFISHPMDMTGNWLKDLGIIGGVWVLANSGPKAVNSV